MLVCFHFFFIWLFLERFDHSPDYDHTDDMVGLSCCPRLKLFASASRDGTIRIWNNDNSLLRLMFLTFTVLLVNRGHKTYGETISDFMYRYNNGTTHKNF